VMHTSQRKTTNHFCTSTGIGVTNSAVKIAAYTGNK
jgi:hypothetical protein